MIDPTSFTRYPAAILYEGESDNMASSWQEYIIATRTDNGIYAVYAKKYVEEWIRGRNVKKMRTVEKVTGIKSSSNFISAVMICADELGIDTKDVEVFDWLEALKNLSCLDVKFSDEVKLNLNPSLLQ
jgi:hypothetical protein